MKHLKFATMSSAIALATCLATVDVAQAQGTSEPFTTQVFLFGSGASLPSIVYRELFDCFAFPVSGDTVPGVCGTGALIGPGNQILYASVGSGAGKSNLISHSSTNGSPAAVPTFTSVFETGSAFLNPPATTTFPYPLYHFTGSDDVLNASDTAKYATANLGFGAELQIPSLVVPVTVVFNGKDGNNANLTINAANIAPIVNYDTSGNPLFDPTGAGQNYTRLNLSRQAVCGIFSGHITKWNNAILTALNNGTQLGTGQITVVHRQDGSGTTFLTTNGLISQCGSQSGPNSETDSTVVSYRFPWGDANTAGICPTPAPAGSNLINWPGQNPATSTGCSIISSPTGQGAVYLGAANSLGVQTTVFNTAGAVGYLSPDFAQPIASATIAPKTANLGDGVGDITAPGSYFLAPTFQLATLSTASTNPPTRQQIAQPLAWSRQGVIPNPDVGTYPIAGYTWLELYECYFNPSLTTLLNYLQFHYTSGTAQTVMQSAGFNQISGAWFNQLAQLVVNSSVSIRQGAAGSGGACTSGVD